MATFNFSALADGQAISFDVNADDLVFDQAAISAADLRFTVEGGNTRVSVVSGANAGKDILLSNVSPLQLAQANVQFANGSLLRFGDNAPSLNDDGGNSLVGGAGNDLVLGFGGNDFMQGGDGADSMLGGAGNDTMSGNNGVDRVDGGAGNDTVAGGSGQDAFVFSAFGAANADSVSDFSSGWDRMAFDGGAFTGAGPAGRLAAGDDRFHAAAGATGGADAEDRFVYNTTTRQLFYDADGSGAGAAQLVATLQAGATLTAADIWVEAPATPPAPAPINGTAGNDTLVGTSGNDTINGLAGDDSLIGNAGNDTLDGGEGFDTLAGGLGDDTYVVEGWQFDANTPADPGGFDTVISRDAWDLADGIEVLILTNDDPVNRWGNGNGLDNLIVGGNGSETLEGREGNDTLRGNGGDDTLSTWSPGGNYGDDSVDGGAGFDTIWAHQIGTGIVVDVAGGTWASSGGSIRFESVEAFHGADFDDRFDASGAATPVLLEGMGGNDTLTGGSGGDTLDGGGGDNVLSGGGGHDLIASGGGNDLVDGGAGNDTIESWSRWDGDLTTGTDTLDGGAGTDTLLATRFSFVDLGAGVARGWEGAAAIASLSNIENVVGIGGADTLVGSDGANVLDGSAGADSIGGAGGNDTILGGADNDTLRSGAGEDSVAGGEGDDWLVVDAGTDTVSGGAGRDRLVFDAAPSSANADLVTDFVSGSDELVFDATAFAAIGAVGNFLEGDERFHAAAGASAGQDASDRIIYDTSTGRVYYDADGSGAGAAQLLATLQGVPAFAATDIHVTSGGVSGEHITGTAGPDNLAGGAGNDTLEGLGGNDTLAGNENNDHLDGGRGSDSMLGGAGNDTLVGGTQQLSETDLDTMDGGLGNDTYVIGRQIGPHNPDRIVLRDAGGIDTIVAQRGSWVLGDGFENLQLGFDWASDGIADGTGNALDNVITGFEGWWVINLIDGGDGDDTLVGGDGDDRFYFAAGTGEAGHDAVDGGFGYDWLDFAGARSGIMLDFRTGAWSGGGNGGSGGGTFADIEIVNGTAWNDRLVAADVPFEDPTMGTTPPTLFGGGGNDTLLGGAAGDSLHGDAVGDGFFTRGIAGFGDDSLVGGAGTDFLDGGLGADWLDGGQDADALAGGAGGDAFVFSSAPAGGAADSISDWQSGSDVLRFDTAAFASLGAQGRMAAGDARFFAGAGASSGQDASDRLILDTAAQQLWYDADGSGTGAAVLVANLSNGTLVATDIIVGLGSTSGPGQTITGTAGNDSLTGGAGNDTLNGLAGNDTLNGGAGNDAMDGGTGNDTFIVSSLSDVLADAGGIDTVITEPGLADYALAEGFENLVLRGAGIGQGLGNGLANRIDASGAAGRVTLDGRAGNDTIIGSDFSDPEWFEDDFVQAGEGDDLVSAGGGDDIVEGWLGADSISGGDGHDRLYGGRVFYDLPGDGNDTIEGGAGNDAIEGGEGHDILRGGAGDDQLWGGLGNDTLLGGDGNDFLSVGELGWTQDPERNLLEGGEGTDWVALGNSAPAVIDLRAGTVTSSYSWWPGSAVLVSIENAQGSSGADLILGNDGANFLIGGGRSDTLDGGGGNDTLLGHGGDAFGSEGETFVFSAAPGAANADVIQSFLSGANVFADTIRLDARFMASLGETGRFSAQDARFHAAAGATGGHDADDRIVLNTATNQLFYDADGSGAQAAQLLFTFQSFQSGSSLAAADIEVVNGAAPSGATIDGTAAGESLAGGGGNDAIDARGGDDTVSGGGGNDALAGGAGRDELTGGAGADLFVLADAPGAANADRIADFASGVDKIQLDGRAMTNLGAPGGLFAGDARFHAAPGASGGQDASDRIVFNTSTGELFYDADGAGGAAAQLVATLQPGAALVVTDLVIHETPAGRETPNEVVQPPLSGDLRIDALLGFSVSWEDLTSNTDDVIQYTFSITEGNQGAFGDDELAAFNAGMQDAARQVLADVTAITGIRFEEVGDGIVAELHFANAPLQDIGAIGAFSWNDLFEVDANGAIARYEADGYVYLDNFTAAAPGSFEYQVLLHEVGHAMSLKHPHDFPVTLFPVDDHNANTVMTYQDTFQPQDTYQEFDVAALHWLYGGDGLGGAGARASGTPPTFGTTASERMAGGEGHDFFWGDAGADTIVGGAGNDWLLGGAGIDFMDGGAGDDRYSVTAGDVLADSGGIDSVYAEASWTLAAGFENLSFQFVYEDGRNLSGTGNALDNLISGNQGNNLLAGLEGNDSLWGWGADDTFAMSFAPGSGYGDDSIDGGLGRDTIDFAGAASAVSVDLAGGIGSGGGTGGAGSVRLAAVENASGTSFADRLIGDAAANVLRGASGADTLTGGSGEDAFLYAEQPSGADADLITDFTSLDVLRFDGAAFARIGADDFATADARFHAAAGAAAGHDADDRIVYDTLSGRVYYDADGSGSGAAQLIATLQGAPNLDASQIEVINGRTDSGGSEPEGGTFTGTPGNDSLVGGPGDDTIDAFAGNDTLDGQGGLDSMVGGAGNDLYRVDESGDVIVEAENAGIDTVHSTAAHYNLSPWVNNLVLMGPAITGGGNAIENVLSTTADHAVQLDGMDGNDTLIGGSYDDELNGWAGDDSMVGGAGNDFFDAFNHPEDGVDTMDGGAGNDSFFVSAGDVVFGGDGTDTVFAKVSWTLGAGTENLTFHTGTDDHDLEGITGIGNELDNVITAERAVGTTLDGKAGNDTLTGDLAHVDDFLFSVSPGAANADLITNFVDDMVVLDGAVHANSGPSGTFAAGDARFWAAAGADAGHDADDRVVYDAASGRLWYDADGSGAGAAQLIATLEGAPSLDATNIEVINGTTTPPMNQTLIGTSGNDTLTGGGGNDFMQGGAGADMMNGGAGNDTMSGNEGVDRVGGGAGNDTIAGGSGQDFFVFAESGAANADTVGDFASGWDHMQFDSVGFAGIGADGRFSSGDDRFHASAGAAGGADAEDRIVFNTSTGQLYYDADGSGAGDAQLVATLQAGAALTAADITVI